MIDGITARMHYNMIMIIIIRRGLEHRVPFLEKELLMDGWGIFCIKLIVSIFLLFVIWELLSYMF